MTVTPPPRSVMQEFARGQRRVPSRAEAILWQGLRSRRFEGFKFRRQVPLGPYIADFVCSRRRLIVEADGPLHESAKARARDAERDTWLVSQRFEVLRLPNDLILGSPELAFRRIEEALQPPASPPAGEAVREAD